MSKEKDEWLRECIRRIVFRSKCKGVRTINNCIIFLNENAYLLLHKKIPLVILRKGVMGYNGKQIINYQDI